MNSRKAIIESLNQVIQETGTLTVLHTNAIASKIDLSATEFEALDIISRYQPITAGQLATYCGLTTGGITGIVDRLEAAGFVKRVRDSKDRRRVFIEPLRKNAAEKKVWKLYRPIAKAFNETVSNYSDDELRCIIRFHETMNGHVKEIIADLRNTQSTRK